MFIVRAIIGFLSGISCSMGIGSGSILILYLTMFEGLEQNYASGINLAFSIPIFLFSIYFNYKNGLICDKNICLKTSVFGMIGALFGCYVSFSIDPFYLRKIFGLFLICISIKGIFSRRKDK